MLIVFLNDPYGIRTRVTAVKGRCLNRLTNGPWWRRRRDLNPRASCPTYTLSRGASSATWVLLHMAPQARFELATDRLTADSSTTELLRNIQMVGLSGLEPPTSRLSGVRSNQLSYRPMERVMGIEPTTSAWKAEVLPLNYTRKIVGATDGNRTHECRNHNPVR
jgi:hypothetical protein